MAPPRAALRLIGAVMAAERERRFYRELPKVVSSGAAAAWPREGPELCLPSGGGPGAGTGRTGPAWGGGLSHVRPLGSSVGPVLVVHKELAEGRVQNVVVNGVRSSWGPPAVFLRAQGWGWPCFIS